MAIPPNGSGGIWRKLAATGEIKEMSKQAGEYERKMGEIKEMSKQAGEYERRSKQIEQELTKEKMKRRRRSRH